jgi:hypothetical protein
MNKERLNMLANFLEHNADKIGFNLANWGIKRGEEVAKYPVPGDGIVEVECGTVCCAVGWACLIPAFNDQGFFNTLKYSVHIAPAYRSGDLVFHGWKAICEFFDINHETADRLFLEGSYDWKGTALDVATRIKDLTASA